MRNLSLRARLLLGVIALAGVGLVAADIVTYSKLDSFLLSQTDSSLDAAHQAVEAVLLGQAGGGSPGGPGPGPGIGSLTQAAPGDFIELRRLNGTIVTHGVVGRFSGQTTSPPPRLPRKITLPAQPTGRDRITFLTVPATKGGGSYRVRASIEPQAKSYILIVAQPLSDVDSILHQLLLIEMLVTALILAAIGGLGLWVIRLGLRPLTEIGATAEAIAGGDLSQRVKRADRTTEVGRLGISLNAMLSQIESAFKAREASERKLRQFVADASHELRTPLAAVRAYAELFRRGASTRPDDLERSMTGISREAERMSLLVEDLLLLARLDEGRPLTRQTVQLDDVVYEAVDAARVVDGELKVELELEPVQLVGDRDQLRQIIDNLFANVRAHTPSDTPVAIALLSVDGNAELTFSDSGPGLTDEQASHVFERFYRIDPSRARARGGVGLGLSIVAAIAQAHGGSVSARPTPGGGATFVISLPLAAT